MIKIFCFDGLNSEHLETVECPLGEAINQMLQHWHEAEGPQLFTFTDNQKNILATLLRGETEDDAIVLYSNGDTEKYKVKYILGNDGMYERTEINEIKS